MRPDSMCLVDVSQATRDAMEIGRRDPSGRELWNRAKWTTGKAGEAPESATVEPRPRAKRLLRGARRSRYAKRCRR